MRMVTLETAHPLPGSEVGASLELQRSTRPLGWQTRTAGWDLARHALFRIVNSTRESHPRKLTDHRSVPFAARHLSVPPIGLLFIGRSLIRPELSQGLRGSHSHNTVHITPRPNHSLSGSGFRNGDLLRGFPLRCIAICEACRNPLLFPVRCVLGLRVS